MPMSKRVGWASKIAQEASQSVTHEGLIRMNSQELTDEEVDALEAKALEALPVIHTDPDGLGLILSTGDGSEM